MVSMENQVRKQERADTATFHQDGERYSGNESKALQTTYGIWYKLCYRHKRVIDPGI